MVGDSLTAIRPTATIGAFRSLGVPIYVDAVSSRRVPADVPGRLSGVRTVTELLAAGNDAPCWIVALGSNDLLWVETPGQYGVDARSTVEAYLDMMVDAINSNNTSQQRPAPRVFWVNLNHHRRYGPEATLFNALLDARATTDASFSVIDWHTLSSANRGWFVDTVHVNAAGYDARAALVADAIAAANSSAEN